MTGRYRSEFSYLFQLIHELVTMQTMYQLISSVTVRSMNNFALTVKQFTPKINIFDCFVTLCP